MAGPPGSGDLRKEKWSTEKKKKLVCFLGMLNDVPI
jgi:hypothetical protein